MLTIHFYLDMVSHISASTDGDFAPIAPSIHINDRNGGMMTMLLMILFSILILQTLV